MIIIVTLIALTGCSAQEEKGFVDEATGVKEVTLTTSKYTKKDDAYYVHFTGFSGRDGENWFISFSQGRNGSTNNFYLVHEGSEIEFEGISIKIIHLEPEENKITIEL